MGTYWIRAALGGDFGGVASEEWEEVEAASLDEALKEAWRRATKVYESYEGLYGLRCISEIMEDEECDEEEAAGIYAEERDNWLDYEATDKRPDDFEPEGDGE